MSSIKLSPNASGTGEFTIAAPNSNTNRTLTLPDNTGTVVTTGSTAGVSQTMLAPGVAGNGPAFSAFQSSAQTISSATYTKLQFQSEEFDTANCFDSTTNFRFTPNVPGYYLFTTSFAVNSFVTQTQLAIYKNGVIFKQGFNNTGSGQPNMSALIYMNGSTDYVEAYAWLGGGQALVTGAPITYFQGFLARAA